MSRSLPPWLQEAAAVGCFAAATLAFFWRALVDRMVPLGHDLFTYFFPYKVYVSQSLNHGEFPLWNHLIFMGAPLIGNIQAGLLYPPNILFYLLPTVDGLTASIVLHVFLAAVFTHLFCRVSLGMSVSGAWIAGAVFAFGGFMGAKVGHLNQLHAAVWLPLLLLGLERGVVARSSVGLAVGAIAFACQVLSGHTQEVYFSGWALGLLAAFLALLGGGTGRNRLAPFAVLAGMVGIGGAVAAGQLLPAVELAGESYRAGGLPLHEAVRFSVVLSDLLDTLLPIYEQVPYIELTGYTGVVSLVLVPAAIAWRRRPPWPAFFAVLALLSLVLSLGTETPLYGRMFQMVPGFDMFRAPGRWLFLYSFSVAVLAGLGAEALRSRWEQAELRHWLRNYALGVAILGASLIALKLWLELDDLQLRLPAPRIVLTWMVFASLGVGASLLNRAEPRSKLAAGLLVSLLLFELYQARVPLEYNRPVPPAIYQAEAGVLQSLIALQPYRTLSLVDPGKIRLDEEGLISTLPPYIEGGQVNEFLNYSRFKLAMMPNTGMSHGLPSLDGYDGGILPTRRYAELKRVVLGSETIEPHITMRDGASAIPSARLMAALGVSHILVNDDLDGYGPEWEEAAPPGAEGVRILVNKRAQPRAYIVHEALIASSDDEALAAITEIDPRHTVVLSQPAGSPVRVPDASHQVQILTDRSNEVVVEVSMDQAGILVLSDTYYPGWKAYVNGAEAELLRANYLVRAVHLDSGSHTVRFSYEPLSVRIGLAISAVGLLATMALLVLPRVRPRPVLPERSVQ